MELNSAMPLGTANGDEEANYFEEHSPQEEISKLRFKAFAVVKP